jgi:hypothetical protein
MKAQLADTKWTRWQPALPPPSTDVEVLLAMGPVTRELMERLPEGVLARARLARSEPQNRYFRQNSRG